MKNQNHHSPVSTFSFIFNSFAMIDMKKIVVILFCGLFSFSGNVQANDLPILKENLKRGIYQTYEQFVNNDPIIADSFYIEKKERKRKNWKGTYSLTPRFTENDKKIKQIWGFCDGTTVYVYHQKEFFPIEMNDNDIDFFGYGNKKGSSKEGVDIMNVGGWICTGGITIVVGLPIVMVGGIVAISTSSSYKKHKVEYTIDPQNGDIVSIH